LRHAQAASALEKNEASLITQRSHNDQAAPHLTFARGLFFLKRLPLRHLSTAMVQQSKQH
jgi:hypothetical protein